LSSRALRLAAVLASALALALPPMAGRAQTADALIVEAREALRKKDKPRLARLRDAAVAGRHPLASWPDYWELSNRLGEASLAEVEAFYARWPGHYVEDRLRNDWLLELGKRRDWRPFAADFPRFRMNDDREVSCYSLLTQHLAGQDVAAPARQAWFAQRELDDGCQLLAATLLEAGKLLPADAWRKARLSAEAGRLRAVRAAVALASPSSLASVDELYHHPARFLKRGGRATPQMQELAVLALLRLAADDPPAAADELAAGLARQLGAERAAWSWAGTGRQAALKLQPQAAEHFQHAWRLQRSLGTPGWSDDTLAWQVRAAVRTHSPDRDRWRLVLDAVEAMGSAERRDPAWTYWQARALLALAAAGAEGEADRQAAWQSLQALSNTLGFYAQLAAEDLGVAWRLPPAPAPPSEAEQAAARTAPGLRRALHMAALGLRDEGRREWNFTLRGMSDRELLAAAQSACDVSDWQLCINTSDRTRQEVDLAQRYPMPYRPQILARAQERGLDPALVFGLIRQETRFMSTLRSHVGASGLMQLMPATARWTARRIGLPFELSMIDDIDTNLKLGTAYLKMVMDDFAGSLPLAAAAYNAGPNRPRRWREGQAMDAAAWAENIPFNETRDYVKRVLANAAVYGSLLAGQTPSIRQRLGKEVGPRDPQAPAADKEIP